MGIMFHNVSERDMKGEKKLNSTIAARIAAVPAAVGFAALFAVNFGLIGSAVILTSAGLICAPLGLFYAFGWIDIISDLSPYTLVAGGLFLVFFGIFLGLCVLKLAPFCVRALYRYIACFRGKRWRRIYSNFKTGKFAALSILFSAVSLGLTVGMYAVAERNGFEGTVVRDRLVFEDAKYIYLSTSSLDFEIKYHDGQGIMIDYVNDSSIIIEESNKNYLRLVQDDSFAISLFAKEQFRYKLTLLLPKNDYREFYLSSGSGDITLYETAAEYTELHTRSGDIKIYDADGEISAVTSDGNIFCSYSDFKGDESFETKSGSLEVEIPENTGVKLKFRSEEGALSGDLMGQPEDFIGSIDIEKPGRAGGTLFVTTTKGNLTVNKK